MTSEEIDKAIATMLPVRMTEAFKESLRASKQFLSCATCGCHTYGYSMRCCDNPVTDDSDPTHLQEFGECQGFVVNWVLWPGNQRGPEVEVYWQPDNLHYMYLPEHLEWAD